MLMMPDLSIGKNRIYKYQFLFFSFPLEIRFSFIFCCRKNEYSPFYTKYSLFTYHTFLKASANTFVTKRTSKCSGFYITYPYKKYISVYSTAHRVKSREKKENNEYKCYETSSETVPSPFSFTPEQWCIERKKRTDSTNDDDVGEKNRQKM